MRTMRLPSNYSELTANSSYFAISMTSKTILACTISFVIAFTAMGNILTLVAVYTTKIFQNSVSNTYIASLAAADLAVSVLVMPWMLFYTIVYDGHWVFGKIWCDVWQSLDYICCTISLYSVCAIAVDRWLNLEKPLRIFKRSKIVAKRAVVVIWTLPIMLWVPVFACLRIINEPQPEGTCHFVWRPNWVVPLVAAPFLYLPVLLLLVIFWRISSVIRSHLRFLSKHSNQDSFRASSRYLDAADCGLTSRASPARFRIGDRSPVSSPLLPPEHSRRRSSLNPAITTFGTLGGDLIKLNGAPPPSQSNARRGSLPQSVVDNIASHFLLPPPTQKLADPREFYSRVAAMDHPSSASDKSSPKRISCSSYSQEISQGECTSKVQQKIEIFRQQSQMSADKQLCRVPSMDSVGSFHDDDIDTEDRQRMEAVSHTHRSSITSDTAAVEFARRFFRPKLHPRLMRAQTSTILEVSHAGEPTFAHVINAAGNHNHRTSFSIFTEHLYAARRVSLNFFSELLPCNGLSQQIRAARAVGVMVLCFLACWLPFLVIWPWKTYQPDQISTPMYHFAIWANYLNSTANPIVYVLCSPRFQNVFKRLLCAWRNKLFGPKFTMV